MIDPNQNIEAQADATYNAALEAAAKTSFKLEWQRFGGDESALETAFEIAKKKGLDFQNQQILVGGKPTQFVVAQIQKTPEFRGWFPLMIPRTDDAVSEATESNTPESPKSSPRENLAKNLTITEDQLAGNFMRKNGLRYLPSGKTLFDSISDGSVTVAKAGESATLNADALTVDRPNADGSVVIPAVTEISKADLNDRRTMRRLEAQYSEVGGALAAIDRGLIKVKK